MLNSCYSMGNEAKPTPLFIFQQRIFPFWFFRGLILLTLRAAIVVRRQATGCQRLSVSTLCHRATELGMETSAELFERSEFSARHAK